MAEDNSRPTNEKLERVSDLLQNLKDDARKSSEEGDTFMTSVYNKLVKVCSPIVTSAAYRLQREDNAELNKKEKELRKKDREAREAARANTQAS